MLRKAGWAFIACAISTAGLLVGAATADAVDTDMAISTTAIDFGQVNVGSSAQASVTLTNTGGDPFGPINIFGGAPPTAEFNASQNCQGTTLPAGGSCMVNYSFSPGAAGTFNDTSSFTISETNSQSDGEDFSVSLSGVGYDPNAPTTTAATTTTTSPTTDTTSPTATTAPGGGNTPGGSTPTGNPAATGAPLRELQVKIEHNEVEPGDEERATVHGFEVGEVVTAVQQPGEVALGEKTADDKGDVEFTWTIEDDANPGDYQFVATGERTGSVSADFEIVAEGEADDGDSGMSPWLIALIVVLVLAAIAGLGYFAYRRGQRSGDDGETPPPTPTPPPTTDPSAPTEQVQRVEPEEPTDPPDPAP